MKKFFSSRRGDIEQVSTSLPSQRRKRSLFTPDFFKFLLGFSIIILFAFLVLASLEKAGLAAEASLWYPLA